MRRASFPLTDLHLLSAEFHLRGGFWGSIPSLPLSPSPPLRLRSKGDLPSPPPSSPLSPPMQLINSLVLWVGRRPTDGDRQRRRRRLCGRYPPPLSPPAQREEGKHGREGEEEKEMCPSPSSPSPLLPLRSLGYRRGSRTSEWTIARGFLRPLLLSSPSSGELASTVVCCGDRRTEIQERGERRVQEMKSKKFSFGSKKKERFLPDVDWKKKELHFICEFHCVVAGERMVKKAFTITKRARAISEQQQNKYAL